MLPDREMDAALCAVLGRAARRVLVRHVLQGVSAAALLLGALSLVTDLRGAKLAASLLAALVLAALRLWMGRDAHARKAVAADLERRKPALQNIVITAEELLRNGERSPAWIRARVIGDAVSAIQRVDVASIWPVRGVAALASVAVIGAAALLVGEPARVLREVATHQSSNASKPATIRVQLTPPAYTEKRQSALIDPERVEVIEGTTLRVEASDAVTAVRLGSEALTLEGDESKTSAAVPLETNGYLAVETSDGRPTRLIPLSVIADRLPEVRVERPGRDLLLPDAIASVPLRAIATDDVGLTELVLHYTKVSGNGEDFDFAEGEVPIDVKRETPQQWRATATLSLGQLALAPGDSLVYRFTARDGRAGAAGLSSSDTYFIEIAGPGQVPLEGVEMPPEQERYALSQQMIVVKIKRLRQRESAMTTAAVAAQASSIAAEQRAVRANFVFLMGGHVEDEEEEAAQSNEIQEGRLEHSSRREMSRAVAHMTAAEQGLVAPDTAAALRAATLAVEALQRAFTQSRYLLRALASRTPLDPTRRLTGARDDAASAERVVLAAAGDVEAARARELLASFLSLASAPGAARPIDPAALSRLAEASLAVNPKSASWQEIANEFIRLRDRSNADRQPAVRAQVARLAARARADAPVTHTPSALQRVESAWAGGGRQ